MKIADSLLCRCGILVAAMAFVICGCMTPQGPSSIEECDGQDADWVRLSFPKEQAEEINALGYTKWVDEKVGYNLENGYFKFVVVIPDGAVFPTEIIMGDLKVSAKHPGEYVFLCEKGLRLQFGCIPFDQRISYIITEYMAIPPFDPNKRPARR